MLSDEWLGVLVEELRRRVDEYFRS